MRRTDGQSLRDSIYRAMHMHHKVQIGYNVALYRMTLKL